MDKEVTSLSAEIKELSKGISDILVAVAKIEVEVRQISTIAGKLEGTEKQVVRIENDLENAFKRIDELKAQCLDLSKKSVSREELKTAKDDKRWLYGFVLGLVGIGWKLLDYI